VIAALRLAGYRGTGQRAVQPSHTRRIV